MPRARGGKLGIFPPPDFMSRLCPLPRRFMVRVVAILCEHGVARSWNAPPLACFSSISRTVLRDTRQLDVLLQRDIYIYIIGSPRTHLLFVSVHGELIIEAFRSSFFFVVCRRRVDEDEFFVYHFIREEDQYFVIFIELGEKKKLSFIGHRWNGQYRKTNYFELWNCALIMYDWFESRIKEILTLIVAHNCSI